jgi:hypothetical protein
LDDISRKNPEEIGRVAICLAVLWWKTDHKKDAMSMYMLPKTIIKRMHSARNRFFWQGSCVKKVLSSEVGSDCGTQKKRGSRSARFKKNKYQLIV